MMKSGRPSPPVQDMPPPGGYPSVRIARNLPDRGPSGLVIWATFLLTITTGLYMVGQGNTKRNAERLEQKRVRLALMPLLQAEADVKFVQGEIRRLKEEAQVMKDVKGWKVGENVYKTGVWMAPSDKVMR